ncbi:probable inactive protein kinase At3g63330 [Selaginella moellendorffii]|uniref:probable inactive protein kinase At3g63330 n=1 Tax=Selaginella moellendorffii TaxID=88036 RepID=UPI000D1C286A|nr:probable inactive protein kinase At3g63330 [Selaginella moellendorffii]|eukprot:XP_024545080.1 probable inactive protein kinase At3g63330 [Selaginella moellendorffii]
MVREINIGSKAMRVGAMLLLLAFLILAIFPAASEPKKVVCHGEDRCLEMDDEVNLAAEWGSFFLDVEIVGGEIGRGAFGRVYNARYPNDSQAYVAKVVMIEERTIAMWSITSEVLGDDGDLWILLGVASLHERGIYHRDIKPDNILVAGGHTRIIDLGSAIDQTSSKTLYRGIGPLRNGESDMRYTAPEARFIDDYRFYLHEGEAFDMWMVGVTLLEVFMGNRSAILPTTLQMQMAWQIDYGMPPRSVAYLLGLSNFCVFPPDKILAGELLETMALQTARCVNQSALSHGFPNKLALELVQSLLRWSPEDRITAMQALNHAYFTGG